MGKSNGRNQVAYSIALDPTGNGDVYTTGYFWDTTDFDPGPGVFNLVSPGATSTDIFISKLDSAGNFIWAKQIGGNDTKYGYSIAMDASGNVYTTGFFSGTADFDPGAGTFNLTASGFTGDIFISKLDSAGNFIWAKQMSGTSSAYGYAIAIDPASGNVYTTGGFQGTTDFDPGAAIFNVTSAGGNDIFISKIDSSGNFVWVKQLGGTNSDWGQSLALDPAGSGALYTIGLFRGTVDFDPGAGVYNLTSASAGNDDLFISKTDSSGNFVWAKRLGGNGNDFGWSIALDFFGNVYTTGYFQYTTDFDPGAGTFNLTATGLSADIFISKLDSTGNFISAKAMGGTGGDGGRSIAIDASGYLHLTGSFNSPSISFSSTTLTNADSTVNISNDVFIAKLDTGLSTDIKNDLASLNMISIFPNPASNQLAISSWHPDGYREAIKTIEVYNVLGEKVFIDKEEAGNRNEVTIDVSAFPSGIYFVRARTAEGIITEKMVK